MNSLLKSHKALIQFGTTPLLTTPAAKTLTPDSPALSVLTDFTKVVPQSVAGDTPIDEAHQKMRHGGVRLLFVMDKQNHCVGVLSAKEVIGSRRINIAMQQRNLEREFKAKVIDRTGLILEIFGARARTRGPPGCRCGGPGRQRRHGRRALWRRAVLCVERRERFLVQFFLLAVVEHVGRRRLEEVGAIPQVLLQERQIAPIRMLRILVRQRACDARYIERPSF